MSYILWVSQVALPVKNLCASAGDVKDMSSIPELGRSQPPPWEEGMATHSSILAWKNPMDGGAQWDTVHRSQRVGHD